MEYMAIEEYETILQIEDNFNIILKGNGDIHIKKKDNPERIYTSEGYLVIKDRSGYKIYHQDGSISHQNGDFTSRMGESIQQGELKQVETLKRKDNNM